MTAAPEARLSDLSPRIRGAVQSLWAAGFKTSDSGDGSNLEMGMECGWDTPMIVVCCRDSRDLVQLSERVFDHFRGLNINPDVQAMYSPKDCIASVLVVGFELLDMVVT